MRSSSLAVSALFGAVLAGGSTACAPASLDVPRCPNPVLLGPVDRVGGHRAQAVPSLGKVTGAASLVNGVASQESVAATLAAPSSGAVELSARILEKTEGRAERDVRVDRLSAGSTVIVFAGVIANRWVKADGRVVEVSRAQ